MPLVADHKCSSPEVYGADISPNMLCAGYFDCKSDACQVSPASDAPAPGRGPDPQVASGHSVPQHCPKTPQWGRETPSSLRWEF